MFVYLSMYDQMCVNCVCVGSCLILIVMLTVNVLDKVS